MKLPPMNALRAFEAVSRLGSVSKAAEELCVSQGAVSQQVRNLEDHLGCELFIRSANSFVLSEHGEDFAGVVQKALGSISLAASEVRQEVSQHTLTISVSPGLADKWLMSQLGNFWELYPDITLALDKSLNNATFRNDGIDAAIRFGDGNFSDLNSVYLFTPRKFAVASPGYIAEYGKIEDMTNPKHHRLINCDYGSKELNALCGQWEDLVADDYPGLEEQIIKLPDEQQVLNAAIHGRGIALTPNHLLSDEIETGNLVFASNQAVEISLGYYFVWPKDARPDSELDAFRDWLVEISEALRSERVPVSDN